MVQSKVPYLRDLTSEGNHLFLTLTETWLSDHSDAELTINYSGVVDKVKENKKRKR